MNRRQLLQFFSGLGLVASVAVAPVQAQDKPIKIGVTAGPHAQIMEVVKKIAEKDGLKLQVVEFSDYIQPNAALASGDLDANSYQHLPYLEAQIMEVVKKIAEKDGLKLQVVEFSDYIQPNAALASGDLDANSYQHLPYLEAQIKDRGYKFASIGYTITFPMGVYSKKAKSLAELKEGARVGVPNDPTNGGRALLLLQAKGLLKLKPNAGLKATPLDIADNPKKIKIVELDAAQLPRSLADLDAAAINGNYAESAGLNPVKDAIAIEDSKGPYANLIAVREQDKSKPWVAKLLKAYHSAEVKQYVVTQFKNSVIVAW